MFLESQVLTGLEERVEAVCAAHALSPETRRKFRERRQKVANLTEQCRHDEAIEEYLRLSIRLDSY
jgi:CRISPR/Cas system-associated exonuclease Cas4 (RecB family)